MIGPTNANGTITKIGTASVGSDLKPIKLVNGVPTAVTNDLVDVASAQNITATKKATYNAFTSASGNTPTGIIDKIGNVTVNSTTSNRYFYLKGAVDTADKLLAGISVRYNANGDVHYSLGTTDSNGSATAYEITRFVRSTNTWTSKMVSDLLDAYTPMVRTTGNQTMTGEKTFTRTLYIINTIEEYDSAPASNTQTLIDLKDKNAVSIGRMEHWAYTGGSSAMNIINNVKRNGIQPSPTLRLSVTDQGVGVVMAVNQRAYNSANNDDVVTIGTLKAATDVVHTSGNETIAGYKTFTSNPRIWLNVEAGAGGGGAYSQLNFNDKGAVERAHVRTQIGNAQTLVEMTAKKFDGSGGVGMGVYNPESGDGFALAPARAYASGTTTQTASDILTKWHLEQAITIGGNKTWSGSQTFNNDINVQSTNYPRVFLKDTNAYAGDSTIGELGSVCGLDRDGNRWGEFRMAKSATDVMSAIVRAYCVSSTNLSASLNVSIDNTGDSWATAPSPIPSRSALRNITISDQAPSGGNNGDIWIQYEV